MIGTSIRETTAQDIDLPLPHDIDVDVDMPRAHDSNLDPSFDGVALPIERFSEAGADPYDSFAEPTNEPREDHVIETFGEDLVVHASGATANDIPMGATDADELFTDGLEDIGDEPVRMFIAADTVRGYMHDWLRRLAGPCISVLAILLLVIAMDGRWRLASASPGGFAIAPAKMSARPAKKARKATSAKDTANPTSAKDTSNPTSAKDTSNPTSAKDTSNPTSAKDTPNRTSANGDARSTDTNVASDQANASGGASGPVTSPAQLGMSPPLHKKSGKDLVGKLNLNTASENELMQLPTVGPAKAERIVVWRKKNGGFRRTADLRRVKGFGYKTFKRLEAFLDVKGETTLH